MLEVKNLTKRYGKNFAVKNISFKINDGEIVGFLGPNGAGKTTTLNIMTGYLASTEGSVYINGIDMLDKPEEAKKYIGYLPDSPPLYNELTVYEYLKFVCELKKVKKDKQKNMISEIMEIVKIEDMKDRLLKNLSKGYRQRVGLAQTLVGYPKVLILDEPMVGLDPKQIIEIRDVIKNLGRKHTIILSSHILSEISAICDRVIIIDKGVILASDTPENLADTMNNSHVLTIRAKGDRAKIIKILEDSDFISDIKDLGSNEENTFDFKLSGIDNKDIREETFNLFSENKLPILMMKASDASLEEIFIEITSDEFRAEETSDEDIPEETEEDIPEDMEEEASDEKGGNENVGDL